MRKNSSLQHNVSNSVYVNACFGPADMYVIKLEEHWQRLLNSRACLQSRFAENSTGLNMESTKP